MSVGPSWEKPLRRAFRENKIPRDFSVYARSMSEAKFCILHDAFLRLVGGDKKNILYVLEKLHYRRYRLAHRDAKCWAFYCGKDVDFILNYSI